MKVLPVTIILLFIGLITLTTTSAYTITDAPPYPPTMGSETPPDTSNGNTNQPNAGLQVPPMPPGDTTQGVQTPQDSPPTQNTRQDTNTQAPTSDMYTQYNTPAQNPPPQTVPPPVLPTETDPMYTNYTSEPQNPAIDQMNTIPPSPPPPDMYTNYNPPATIPNNFPPTPPQISQTPAETAIQQIQEKQEPPLAKALPQGNSSWYLIGVLGAFIVLVIVLIAFVLQRKKTGLPTLSNSSTIATNNNPNNITNTMTTNTQKSFGTSATVQTPPGYETLRTYLQQGMQQGIAYQQLYQQLVQSGWDPNTIQQTYQIMTQNVQQKR